MNPLDGLGPQDLERLSAFVDGALSPRERAAVEARLGKDPELGKAVDELRAVKAALASLPERRVPRSFALRPADVARRSPAPAFPYLRFATVAASVLFVLTSAVRSISFLPSFGAAPPQGIAAAELQEGVGQPIPGTPTVGAELRAEAPAATMATEESLFDLSGTPKPGEACPSCPYALDSQKQDDEAGVNAFASRSGASLPGVAPLAAAQVLLGLTAVILATLTVRARRR